MSVQSCSTCNVYLSLTVNSVRSHDIICVWVVILLCCGMCVNVFSYDIIVACDVQRVVNV